MKNFHKLKWSANKLEKQKNDLNKIWKLLKLYFMFYILFHSHLFQDM